MPAYRVLRATCRTSPPVDHRYEDTISSASSLAQNSTVGFSRPKIACHIWFYMTNFGIRLKRRRFIGENKASWPEWLKDVSAVCWAALSMAELYSCSTRSRKKWQNIECRSCLIHPGFKGLPSIPDVNHSTGSEISVPIQCCFPWGFKQ